MPEFYAFLQSLIARDDPPWFYLSASPYNLYPFLRFFTRKHYPHGTIILRDSSWQTLPGLLSNLTVGTHEYKVDRMTKVHSWLPRRKMILIGDSTQSDPEAYGEIYRKFPGWVRLILIRKVTDIASIGIAAKNEPERFEKAFQGVPRCRWAVFEDPTDVYALVQDLVRPDNPDDERLPTTVEEERKKDKRRSHPVGHSTSQGGKGGSRRHRRYVSEDVAVYRNRSRSSSRRRPYR